MKCYTEGYIYIIVPEATHSIYVCVCICLWWLLHYYTHLTLL